MRCTDNICYTIRQYLHEFSKSVMKPVQVPPQDKVTWKRPPPDGVKVNFDASYHADTGRGAWGGVAHTDQGEFLAAKAGTLEHLTRPLHAEALACVLTTEASAELGIHRMILESDSQVLVHALNSGEYERALIGVLLRETRSICHANFESFSYSFCNKNCNNCICSKF